MIRYREFSESTTTNNTFFKKSKYKGLNRNGELYGK